MNSPETYYILMAQAILHWWMTLAISFVLIGLVPIFFFTQHQGVWYRIGFLMLLAILGTFVYVLVLDRTERPPTPTDAMLPIVFTSWNFLVWVRAGTLLKALHWHREKMRVAYLRELINHVQLLPYVQTVQFAERLERWQKWIYAMIFMAFASGMLSHNVGNVERVLRALLQSNQKVEVLNKQAKAGRDSIARELHRKALLDRQKIVADSIAAIKKAVADTAFQNKLLGIQNITAATVKKIDKKVQGLGRPGPINVVQPEPKSSLFQTAQPDNTKRITTPTPTGPILKGRKSADTHDPNEQADTTFYVRIP